MNEITITKKADHCEIKIPLGCGIIVNGESIDTEVKGRYKAKQLEKYWFIDHLGIALFKHSTNDLVDKNRYIQGNMHRTKEEAEEWFKGQKFISEVRDWLAEKNEGWVPDWNSPHEEKYSLYYTYAKKKLKYETVFIYQQVELWKYGKFEEIMYDLINQFDNELLKKYWIG